MNKAQNSQFMNYSEKGLKKEDYEEQIKMQIEMYKMDAIAKAKLGRPFSQEPSRNHPGPDVIIDDGSMFAFKIK